MVIGSENTRKRFGFACGWKEERKSSTVHFFANVLQKRPYTCSQTCVLDGKDQLSRREPDLLTESHLWRVRYTTILTFDPVQCLLSRQKAVQYQDLLANKERLKNRCGTDKAVWHGPCWDTTGMFLTTQYHYSLDWDESGRSVTRTSASVLE